jgi:hypothetical protein
LHITCYTQHITYTYIAFDTYTYTYAHIALAQRSEGRSRRPGGAGQQTQHRCNDPNDWDNDTPTPRDWRIIGTNQSLIFGLRIALISWRCTDWDRGTLGVKVKRPPQSVVDLVVDLEFSTDINWIGASSLVRWPGWPGWP